MIGNPGVTVSKHDGNDQIYVFVNGGDGKVQLHYWDVKKKLWQSGDLGGPAAGIDGSPAAISSVQYPPAREPLLHGFIRGADGHLYEKRWDGTQWLDWLDHGQPVWNVELIGGTTPGVDTCHLTIDDPPIDIYHVYAFVRGDDGLLYRYAHPQNVWSFQGRLPNGSELASEPAAIFSVNFSANPATYCYVVGYTDGNGRLCVNFSTDLFRLPDGSFDFNWQWRDLGQPNPDTTVVVPIIFRDLRPAAVAFGDQGRCFVEGSDGQLWVNSWGGGDGPGVWTPLGIPPDGTKLVSCGSAVAYAFNGTQYLYVFVRTEGQHLSVCRWDGAHGVLWADMGQPTTDGINVPADPGVGNTSVSSSPGVVLGTLGTPYAFVLGTDGHLHVCYWSGGQWLWDDITFLESQS
jgi:hypothetical protein